MERYQHGKIYKIVCNITGKIYIGSTCKKLLSQRLAGHNSEFKRWKNGKIHKTTSFEILEGGDYYIELIELVSCNSKDELLIKEKFHIKNNDCINKCKNLNRTEEDLKEYYKEYREQNKNKIKEYREQNKDKMKEYYKNNKEKLLETQKEYTEKNKEKIKEYQKNYRKQNKIN
jgi:hypothetical protein